MTIIPAVILALLALCGAPASADVTYTITLTDEQAAVVTEQVARLNALRRASKGQPLPPPRTAADVVADVVTSTISGWEVGQQEHSTRRPWSERTTHEKRLTCRRDKLTPCPQ